MVLFDLHSVFSYPWEQIKPFLGSSPCYGNAILVTVTSAGKPELPLGWEQQRRSEAGPRTLPSAGGAFPTLWAAPGPLGDLVGKRWACRGQMGKADPDGEGVDLEICVSFLL